MAALLSLISYEKNNKPKSDERPDECANDIRIVVLQRGWVFIGLWNKRNDDEIALSNAYCIRRWGTTEGLGELARKGKLSSTILDKAKDTVHFHPLSCIFSIPCEESKWKELV